MEVAKKTGNIPQLLTMEKIVEILEIQQVSEAPPVVVECVQPEVAVAAAKQR